MEKDHSETGPNLTGQKRILTMTKQNVTGPTKNLAMFNRYNTVDQEDAVAAMNKLDDFLANQRLVKSSDDVQTHPNIHKKGTIAYSI